MCFFVLSTKTYKHIHICVLVSFSSYICVYVRVLLQASVPLTSTASHTISSRVKLSLTSPLSPQPPTTNGKVDFSKTRPITAPTSSIKQSLNKTQSFTQRPNTLLATQPIPSTVRRLSLTPTSSPLLTPRHESTSIRGSTSSISSITTQGSPIKASRIPTNSPICGTLSSKSRIPMRSIPTLIIKKSSA